MRRRSWVRMHAGGSKERGVNYVSLLFASSHEELADSLSQINEQLENGGFLQARSCVKTRALDALDRSTQSKLYPQRA